MSVSFCKNCLPQVHSRLCRSTLLNHRRYLDFLMLTVCSFTSAGCVCPVAPSGLFAVDLQGKMQGGKEMEVNKWTYFIYCRKSGCTSEITNCGRGSKYSLGEQTDGGLMVTPPSLNTHRGGAWAWWCGELHPENMFCKTSIRNIEKMEKTSASDV